MADLAHLEKMSRELKCPICWSLLKSAVSLACNHIFCNLCIKESMRSMSNCPVCKVPFRRREIRAAPHMDNLVSIYKNMEVASGINILSTQTSPLIQAEGDPEKNKLASAIAVKSQMKSKRKRSSKIRKDISKHSPQRMPKQPSFPANKRVHVTPYPISETPLRSPKFSLLEDPEVQLTDDKELGRNERMVPDSEEDGLLQPFFWLKDDDGDDESPKKLSQQQIMETPSPYSAPRFSDIKDSDDDKTTNTSTNELGFACDSELFDWTQRACSPELCLTPQRTQMHNQSSKRVLHMPEEKCQDSYSVAAPSDTVTKEDDKIGRHDAREKNLKKKRKQKGKIKSTKVKSPQRCQYDNNGEGATDFEEMFKTVSPGEQRIGKVHCERSVNYKKSSSPTDSNNEKDNAAPVTHEQSLHISSKAKYDAIKDNMASYRKGKRIKMTYPEQPMSKKSKAEQVKLLGDIEDSANGAEKQEQVCQVKLPDSIESIQQHSKLRKCFGSISKKRVKRRQKQKLEETIADKFERNEGSSMVDAIAMDNPGSENNQISSKTSMDSQTEFIVKSTPSGKEAFQGNTLRRCEKLNSPVQCTFCHSSNDTEDSGEMMHYFNGNPVAPYFNGRTNIIHSHKNCTEWAPDVYFKDGIAINLTAEVSRSRRIKCSCCGVKGAALGCYEKSCRKSFHFTCAKLMAECKWDTQNFVMLCPLHASIKLPYEVSEFQRQRRKSSASKSSSQELLTRNSYDNQNQLWTWPLGSPFKWVLCCSALSAAEKETVVKFSKMSGVPVVDKWKPEVTHVIASTDYGGAYKRTLKVLKGIINGKWILKVDWVRDCIESLKPIAEEKYEATIDVHGISNSPRVGRLRAINKEPKLFSGLTFYLSGDYSASYKGYLQDLVIAAGGAILQRRPISRDNERLLGVSSADKILIVYSVEHPQKYNLNSNRVIDCRRSDAEALADASGCTLVTSAWIIDSIAACKLQP
ncbi:protein BREAST CANCER SUSCEPTIBILITY 1 homolog [Zingiber officinale]|uniref:Uncharacterized protein n=1 Tax=Zingiber officinale TaxID=94328 RepID=A0A8J5C2H4_ZINOF|nr:protein BREAST CANCER SUSCEPTIBILITY 1 homolog [Zingiber officinale]XP_042448093.1 protein BREAST CANCER SUSCEPTIBILITY 1 homolog [Zingiber officinale]KAG6471070.1 hypothetical protein ZIOFF_072166 [Zingiber officinale]